MKHKILELYSGIGGMHCAWNESGLKGEITMAVDVNNIANDVYKHNFPGIHLINRNIQSLTAKEINELDVDTVLMSPPCQPFSRNGKYLDENDPRTNSFIYFIDLLGHLEKINYILMENVKGFECSTVRNLFVNKLKECNFDFQEYLLNPTSVGVPNSRLRYYCLARKNVFKWHSKEKEEIIKCLPKNYNEPFALKEIIQNNVPDTFLVSDKLLKWANVFDICHKESKRSCCFTKAYTHYVEGTGSVYTDLSPEEICDYYKKANMHQVGNEEFISTIKNMKLRFFTPTEVLSLMSFPQCYSFPDNVTLKQCYRLLGNSVNVKVISELLKIIFDQY